MNIRKMTADELAFLSLPEEAFEALREGREWECEPESSDGAHADVYYCDDCDGGTWHLTWRVWGLSLDSDGNLYETEWSVDTDGNWAYHAAPPYGTVDHDKEYRAVRANWREYAAWVIENGRDPVGEFTRSHEAEPEEVTVSLSQADGGVRVEDASSLSERAREFLCLTAGDDVSREFATLDEFSAGAMNVEWVDERTIKFSLTRGPRTSTTDEIVAQAQAHLDLRGRT
jgi:hypothetical protein